MNWSVQKQTLYIALAIVVVGTIVGVPVYFKFFKKVPNCTDGILNQDEKQVDCGGVCAKLCADEAKMPIVSFERLFKSAKGVYSVVAMVENINREAFSKEVGYIFNLYDENNVLLVQKQGKTRILPAREFPVFEYGLYTGERIPKKVTFSFLGDFDWTRGVVDAPKIDVLGEKVFEKDGLPRIEASLINREVYRLEKFPVYALIYDAEGNLFAASQTYVELLPAKGEVKVVFGWNDRFEKEPSKIDIIPEPPVRGME